MYPTVCFCCCFIVVCLVLVIHKCNLLFIYIYLYIYNEINSTSYYAVIFVLWLCERNSFKKKNFKLHYSTFSFNSYTFCSLRLLCMCLSLKTPLLLLCFFFFLLFELHYKLIHFIFRVIVAFDLIVTLT